MLIDGDTRCAGTYINDPEGSSNESNVMFDSDPKTLPEEQLECLIPIRTIRNITIGEELLVEYGDLYFNNSNPSSETFQAKVIS